MIKRFLNVVNDDKDLEFIDNMVNVNKTQRDFHFHKSYNDDSFFPFLSSELNQEEINLFYKYISPITNLYNSNISLGAAYINCHPCYIGGEYHSDFNDAFTIIYYPKTELNLGIEGGTEFKDLHIENYIGNSLIIFDPRLIHRAVPHTIKKTYRCSITFKLNNLKQQF